MATKTYEWGDVYGPITALTTTSKIINTQKVKDGFYDESGIWHTPNYGIPAASLIYGTLFSSLELNIATNYHLEVHMYLDGEVAPRDATENTLKWSGFTRVQDFVTESTNGKTMIGSYGHVKEDMPEYVQNNILVRINSLSYRIKAYSNDFSSTIFEEEYVVTTTQLTLTGATDYFETLKGINLLSDLKKRYKLMIPLSNSGTFTGTSRNLTSTATTVSLQKMRLTPAYLTNHVYYVLGSDGETYTTYNRNSPGSTAQSFGDKENKPLSTGKYWTIPTAIEDQVIADNTVEVSNTYRLATSGLNALGYKLTGEKVGSTVYGDTGKTTSFAMVNKLNGTYSSAIYGSLTNTSTASLYVYTEYTKHIVYTMLVEEDEFYNAPTSFPTPSTLTCLITSSSYAPITKFALYKDGSALNNPTALSSYTNSSLSATTTYKGNSYETITKGSSFFMTQFFMGPKSGAIQGLSYDIEFSSTICVPGTDIPYNEAYATNGKTQLRYVSTINGVQNYIYCIGVSKIGSFGEHYIATYADLRRRIACLFSSKSTSSIGGLNTMSEYISTTMSAQFKTLFGTNTDPYGPVANDFTYDRIVSKYEPKNRTSYASTTYEDTMNEIKNVISNHYSGYNASRIPLLYTHDSHDYEGVLIKDLMLASNSDFGPTIGVTVESVAADSVTLGIYIASRNYGEHELGGTVIIQISETSDFEAIETFTYTYESDTEDISFNVVIPNLTPKTTYYVRAIADDYQGLTTYSSVKTFTTTQGVLATTTCSLASNNPEYVVILLFVTAGGTGTVTDEGIEVSTTSDFSGNVSVYGRMQGKVSSTPYTVTITGLTTGTRYYYRSFATNAAGTAYSATQNFLKA